MMTNEGMSMQHGEHTTNDDESHSAIGRRSFLRGATALGVMHLVASADAAAEAPRAGSAGGVIAGVGSVRAPVAAPVPMRMLGSTGIQVSAMGLGGFHLGSTKNQQETNDIVSRALDAGINFFDNAWEYHDGLSESRVGAALMGKRDRAVIMTKVCTHGRDKTVAMRMLEESLRRLKTDHIDVWQVHEVIYENDPDLIFAPNGAAEALLQAKKDGKVRAIGFTGHKDPSIHLRMLAHDFPFDTVQMPLNCLDATFRSFEQHVLPEATKRKMGVLGMKSMGGSGEIVKFGAASAEDALRYAMSLPVSVTISGVETMQVLEQNLSVAQGFQPMSSAEMQALREHSKQLASDGHGELFKTSKLYDAKEGRQQHHFPPESELPL